MSAKIRQMAADLRQRYARRFGLDTTAVEVREFVNEFDRDDAEAWAPTRPDLPRWTLG